ncbi:aminoacylase-1-like [Planococcus citri]|uniref:aminoacylase-1-like n=1 Tax=Planococcus citri TaxID=170843 RepID=UPI0031F9A024
MEKEHQAVTTFRKYLRIPTVHPNVNYDKCVSFLTNLADELELPFQIIEIVEGKPLVVITWIGTNPKLPSLLLNSHMDVVPVFPNNWKYGPFDAFKDENGNIYARGTQDMKCVGIQYIETIRKYIKEGLRFKRTIHILFVPDEEIGGEQGMGIFVKTPEFLKLNVGFALDEGMANESSELYIFYAERPIWYVSVICNGNTGHGSLLHENTAAEKLQRVINKFLEYREKEKRRLHSNPDFKVGNVTTINLTMVQGGIQMNVVPPEISVGFDIRLSIDVDHEEFHRMIESWCKEAGEGVRLEFRKKNPYVPPTPLDDSNPWWIEFKSAIEKMELKWKPMISTGSGDIRYIREVGIPAIGFSPMINTPVLMHDHDEFLNEKIFLFGLDVYYNVIKNLASL